MRAINAILLTLLNITVEGSSYTLWLKGEWDISVGLLCWFQRNVSWLWLIFPPCRNTWNFGINTQCIIMSLSSLQGSGEKITNECVEYRDASIPKRKWMAYGTSIKVNLSVHNLPKNHQCF